MAAVGLLRIGKEFALGYRLRGLRGRGAFGSVWEAEDREGQTVALKFLPCGDGLNVAQELRSIQIVQRLSHANLTRVHQVCCHWGYVVVSMELADGNLGELLELYREECGAPLSTPDLCYYLRQVARAIDFLNARQHVSDGQRVAIQHCDVKPTNMLVFGDTVKLCDYGLVSLTAAPLRPHRRAGTFEYAAPEVFQGRLSDRTDQYSLAASYCMLRGGRPPFPPPTAHVARTYVRPEPDLTMIPERERSVIARALARAPHDRWSSCEELIEQLLKRWG